jgi:hypothetical protein
MPEKIISACEVCDRKYQNGPHRYEGHRLELYGNVFCCDVCWNGNHDGWAPQCKQKLLQRLRAKGIPIPKRNAKGLLPRN